MDRADIPIEVALSIVLAAAVDGADRRSLLTALGGPRPVVEGLPRPRPAEGGTRDGSRDGTDDGAEVEAEVGAPALVFAFPAPADPDEDPEGPAAA